MHPLHDLVGRRALAGCTLLLPILASCASKEPALQATKALETYTVERETKLGGLVDSFVESLASRYRAEQEIRISVSVA